LAFLALAEQNKKKIVGDFLLQTPVAGYCCTSMHLVDVCDQGVLQQPFVLGTVPFHRVARLV